MNKILVICLLSIVFSPWFMVYGQDIPVGSWRMHVSFTDIHSVAVSPSKIYGAAQNGVMIFDRIDNSISTLTKIDGLSSTNITQIAFDHPRNQLLITYSDGDVDVVRESEIINFSTLKNSPTISGSKRINHIMVSGNLAYFSTNFGVVVFDLTQLAVKETWRDIGPGGTAIRINQSTLHNDSIFLATEAGVLKGDVNDNLLDYNNWKRQVTGTFNGNIQSIINFNNQIFVAINGSGIYSYNNGTWTLKPYLAGLQYKNLTANASLLLITEGSNLHSVNVSDVVTKVSSDEITEPEIAFLDESNKFWIGDNTNGIVSDKTGTFESYRANGPAFSGGFRLFYNAKTNDVMAVSGGFTGSLLPMGNAVKPGYFKDGRWFELAVTHNNDLTDVDVMGEAIFISSHGFGLQKIEAGSVTVMDDANSPLQNIAAGNHVRVAAIENSSAGLWVTNAGALQPLHLLKTDGTWESFSFPLVSAARFPTTIAVDYLGNVWMVLNPANGGGILVFNRDANQSVYLTNVAGAGGLPNRSVYSIAIDRDGFVWVGTEEGVGYFPNPGSVFSANVNAVKPVFGSRFLLRDEKVTAIEVDGGNRKWMGTENGVWLFDPFGEKQIHNFNTTNSPLLSNKIVDLEINDQTGELFLITDAGIASFRSNATTGESVFNKIKIFPNPVTAQFNGQVGISGLVTDAIVKITDVSGKLVWQTTANGGSTSWNVRDYTGKRAATGIYLVFCITQDGTESMVGKIAVVN